MTSTSVSVDLLDYSLFAKLFKAVQKIKNSCPLCPEIFIVVSDERAFDCIQANMIHLTLDWPVAREAARKRGPVFKNHLLEEPINLDDMPKINGYPIMTAVEFEHLYSYKINVDTERSSIAVVGLDHRGHFLPPSSAFLASID